MPLSKFIQDPNVVIKLEPQELAGYIIQDLKQELEYGRQTFFKLVSYLLSLRNQYPGFSQPEVLVEAVNEAIAWLIGEALLMQDFTDTSGDLFKLTRRAKLLQNPEDINKIIKVREILPKALLHPMMAQHAVPIFDSGKYDTAVFEAFKQVEIAVKNASGLSAVGATLMKQSFAVNRGILTDVAADASEQEGMMFVFAGASQLFRNSTGHNNVVMKPTQAAALIVHASTLMYLVDECEARLNTTTKMTVTVSP